jgi:type IX secretion system PorP/SprF family membrane protein
MWSSIAKKTGLLVLLVSLGCSAVAQYFQQYSNYHFNGFILNPAYAGSREVLSACFLHRDQWIGFPGAPVTQTLSAHTPLKKLSSSAGFNFFNDKLGVTRHTGFFADYSYRFKTSETGRFSIGMSAGVSFFRSWLSQIETTELNDEAFNGSNFKNATPNFGFGMFYYTPRFFAGLSWPLLIKYSSDLSRSEADSLFTSPVNMFLQAGYIFRLNNDLKLKTSVMIKNYQKYEGQLDFSNSLIVFNTLQIGFSVRSKDAFIGTIEFQINDKLRIGYAHDFVTSRLAKYTHGSNEIVIRYEPVKKMNYENTRFF